MAGTTKYFVVVYYLCLFSKFGVNSDSILCTNDYCPTYIDDGNCVSPSNDCNFNNATHNGMWMLSPTPCNCCQFCLPFYRENEHCSLGGPGEGTTVGRCGGGLTCVKHDDGNSYCQRMDTVCHREQDDYDKRLQSGQVGALEYRPRCDEKGKYEGYACVPTQTCYCQSDDGDRLFGEAIEDVTERWSMECGCSRLNYRIQKFIGAALDLPVIGPRCTSDGNFNPVQCVDRLCYCVNKVTGQIIGKEKIHLDEQPVSALSCYDKELDIYPIQNEGDPPYEYTTECYKKMNTYIDLVKESIEQGYNMDYHNEISECLPDGTFGRIGHSRNNTKICLDFGGRKIKTYEALPNTQEYNTMDCKCAATVEIMSSMIEKPICCSNGNFRQIQCRRSMCRCVDSNGRQVGTESDDVTKLSCYKADWKNC